MEISKKNGFLSEDVSPRAANDYFPSLEEKVNLGCDVRFNNQGERNQELGREEEKRRKGRKETLITIESLVPDTSETSCIADLDRIHLYHPINSFFPLIN